VCTTSSSESSSIALKRAIVVQIEHTQHILSFLSRANFLYDDIFTRTADAQMDSFQQERLPNSQDHIRLLQLNTFSTSNDIQCTLTTYRLESRPVYAAISYTWGRIGGARETIRINGKRLAVQKNLFDFFRKLQRWQESRPLWIDAVCIDQGHLQERNHQVQLMSTIYTNAEEVLVWLGPRTKTSDLAMDFLLNRPDLSKGAREPIHRAVQEVRRIKKAERDRLTKLAERAQAKRARAQSKNLASVSSGTFPRTPRMSTHRSRWSERRSSPLFRSSQPLGGRFASEPPPDEPQPDEPRPDKEMQILEAPRLLASSESSSPPRSKSPSPALLSLDEEMVIEIKGNWRLLPFSESWSAVAELCGCEYWKRAWILQEVTVANKVTIFCGSKKIPRVVFENAFTADEVEKDRMEIFRYSNRTPFPDTTRTDLQYTAAAQVLSSRKWEKSRTLVELLFQYQEPKCHDVRDRIFALLSLASDCSPRAGLSANYALDRASLFFEVMSFCRARNTLQFGVLLQNILEIEPGRPPRAWARALVEQAQQEIPTGRQFQMIEIWATSRGFLGPRKTLDEMGSCSPGLSCFECPSQRFEVIRESGADPVKKIIYNRDFTWFTNSAARVHDRVYHLSGGPTAFLFRDSGTVRTFVGLAIVKKYEACETAAGILEAERNLECIPPPASPPKLTGSALGTAPAMVKITVDVATLVNAIVLSYEPTEYLRDIS
jgi:Heterokaryon incompatibility protein (HET)